MARSIRPDDTHPPVAAPSAGFRPAHPDTTPRFAPDPTLVSTSSTFAPDFPPPPPACLNSLNVRLPKVSE